MAAGRNLSCANYEDGFYWKGRLWTGNHRTKDALSAQRVRAPRPLGLGFSSIYPFVKESDVKAPTMTQTKAKGQKRSERQEPKAAIGGAPTLYGQKPRLGTKGRSLKTPCFDQEAPKA